MIREDGENAAMDVGVHGIHPELLKLLGRMKFRSSYGQNALKHSIEVAHLSGLLAGEVGVDVRMAKRAGLLHDIGKSIDHEVEGSHIQIGVNYARNIRNPCRYQCGGLIMVMWSRNPYRLYCTGCRCNFRSKSWCKT